MKFNILYKSFILVFLVCSCESVVSDFEIKEHAPRPNLICYTEADTTPNAYFGRTMTLKEPVDYYNQTNATVELYENGSLVSTLIYKDSLFRDENYTFKPGHKYSIRAKADGLEEATADFSIPESPVILGYKTKLVTNHDCYECDNDKNLLFTVKFAPLDNVNNYELILYRIFKHYSTDEFGRIDDSLEYIKVTYVETRDPAIITTRDAENSYYNTGQDNWNTGYAMYFNDENMQADTHSVSVILYSGDFLDWEWDNLFDPATDSLNFEVHLSSIDDNLMDYAYSKGLSYMSEDNPFVEPVTIFSNVENGVGLVCGKNKAVAKYDVTDLAKEMYGNRYN